MTPPQTIAAITGAARGIGAAFARELARRGWKRLVLIDVHGGELRALAAELTELGAISVDIAEADLSTHDGRLFASGKLSIEPVGLLINNAGISSMGRFWDLPVDEEIETVQVNVVAPMILCHAVLPGMLSRRSGAIINVSSTSALTRFPLTATYNGTKGFLRVFSESLLEEVRGTGVSVQTLCPGATRTSFAKSPRMTRTTAPTMPDAFWMAPEFVVKASLDALERGSGTVIPGWKNRLLVLALGNPFGRGLLVALRRARALAGKGQGAR